MMMMSVRIGMSDQRVKEFGSLTQDGLVQLSTQLNSVWGPHTTLHFHFLHLIFPLFPVSVCHFLNKLWSYRVVYPMSA